MSFVLITHTPEQAEHWRRLIRSSPQRVIATLALSPDNAQSAYGDTQADIWPAMSGLAEAAKENGKTWKALVDAGIADALCKNVTDIVAFCTLPPETSLLVRRQMEEEVCAPYHLALLALVQASLKFSAPPTPTDLKVIAALKRHWGKMMDRLWNEPGNTLKPEHTHTHERAVVGRMVFRIVFTDPSFLSVIYSPSDKTIPVISRYWTYSTRSDFDTKINSDILTHLLAPPNFPAPPAIEEYRLAHPPPSRDSLLSRILHGAGTSNSPGTFLATLTSHLTKSDISLTGAEHEVHLLYALYCAARPNGTAKSAADKHTPFRQALRNSQPLWTALFTLVVKCAKTTGTNLQVEAESSVGVLAGMTVVVVANVLHDCVFDAPDARASLATIMIRAGLFQALEDTIVVLLQVSRMTYEISRIYLTIRATLGPGSPELDRVLRAELPRPRLFRPAFDEWHALGIPMVDKIDRTRAEGSLQGWDQYAWEGLLSLGKVVLDPTLCSRRGCDMIATARCVKCKIGYCGAACQKTAWREHKLVCGFECKDNQITAPWLKK